MKKLMKYKMRRKLRKKVKKTKLYKKVRRFRIIKFVLRALKKLLLIGGVLFVSTFALYMFNGENKLIYYVIRPLLNKHYDSQTRDRRI